MLEITSLNKNQIIRINELAQIREDSDEFRVMDLFHGGMGICVKVRNEISGNEYALKTVKSAFVEEHLSWTMFVEEMKTWLTLSACDGVVEAYCIARINELPYVCAKWMKGGDLRPLITTKDSDFFYKNVVRIIRTLEWANTNHQIIHRDIKPENILLDDAGLAYVTDWGLARPVAEETRQMDSLTVNRVSPSRPELTQAGEFRGTIIYASPEQIMGLKNIDHRSDIYSLGCILYEWETGKPLFLGNTAEEIAYRHLAEPSPRVGSFLRRTNFGVEKIIQKCLEKNPSDRFQNYASLANAVIDISRQRGAPFTAYIPRERFSMPEIGRGEFSERVKSRTLAPNRGKDSSHFVVDYDEIEPYIKEAEALVAIEEWRKASDIYGSLFVAEATLAVPDYEYCQAVAVNYAVCLIKTDSPEKAISVLQCLDKAKSKPATYYVNLSLAYLDLNKMQEAEEAAKQGFSIYKNDKDICGNLLISQILQGKRSEALITAQTRLQLGRDVHALEEVATLLTHIGQDYVETNLPEAVKHFRSALEILSEAKRLNPRFVSARLSLANVLFDLHQYSEVTNELSEMFKLPVHKSFKEFGVIRFAMCLDRSGLHKECVDFCSKWLEQFPDNLELQRTKAETIIDGFCVGRKQDGIPVVERSSLEFFETIVDEKDKRKVSDFCYLARLYEWVGKVDEAMGLLDEAENLEPNYWEIPFNRASFQWRLNQLEDSLPNALKATQIAPWRTQTWRLLARIYSSLKLEEKAKEATSKAEFVESKRDELFDFTNEV